MPGTVLQLDEAIFQNINKRAAPGTGSWCQRTALEPLESELEAISSGRNSASVLDLVPLESELEANSSVRNPAGVLFSQGHVPVHDPVSTACVNATALATRTRANQAPGWRAASHRNAEDKGRLGRQFAHRNPNLDQPAVNVQLPPKLVADEYLPPPQAPHAPDLTEVAEADFSTTKGKAKGDPSGNEVPAQYPQGGSLLRTVEYRGRFYDTTLCVEASDDCETDSEDASATAHVPSTCASAAGDVPVHTPAPPPEATDAEPAAAAAPPPAPPLPLAPTSAPRGQDTLDTTHWRPTARRSLARQHPTTAAVQSTMWAADTLLAQAAVTAARRGQQPTTGLTYSCPAANDMQLAGVSRDGVVRIANNLAFQIDGCSDVNLVHREDADQLGVTPSPSQRYLYGSVGGRERVPGEIGLGQLLLTMASPTTDATSVYDTTWLVLDHAYLRHCPLLSTETLQAMGVIVSYRGPAPSLSYWGVDQREHLVTLTYDPATAPDGGRRQAQ